MSVPIVLQASNVPISKLPFELLHIILDHAIPPRLFLNPSFSFGPNSAWSHAIRQLKSHVLVCKMWWEVGIDILYQDVTIRRVDQIPALLRSFELNTRLGHLVHSFQVHCYVPPSFMRMVCHGLSKIPNFCPNITRLVINHNTESGLFLDPTRFQSLFSGRIADLELLWDRKPINHLALCKNLRSLTIDIKHSGMLIPPLVFNCLEKFYCTFHSNSDMEHGDSNEDGDSFEDMISQRWAMPNLKGLSVYDVAFNPAVRRQPRCLPFLWRYGKSLTYLCVRGIHPAKSWQIALSLCPSLRHLVVEMIGELSDYPLGCGLFHRTLEYIDFWGCREDHSRRDWQAQVASIITSHRLFFRALRNVRIIDNALFDTVGLRLPIAISPDWSDGSWIYHGICISHCPFILERNDMNHLDSYYEIIKPDYEDKRHAKMSGDEEDAVVDSDDPDDYEWFPSSCTPSEPSEEYESGTDLDEDESMSLRSALEIFACRQVIEYASSTEDESNS